MAAVGSSDIQGSDDFGNFTGSIGSQLAGMGFDVGSTCSGVDTIGTLGDHKGVDPHTLVAQIFINLARSATGLDQLRRSHTASARDGALDDEFLVGSFTGRHGRNNRTKGMLAEFKPGWDTNENETWVMCRFGVLRERSLLRKTAQGTW